MATTARKPQRTTLADLMAAAALGTIDPSTEVVTAEDAAALAAPETAPTSSAPEPIIRNGTEHVCEVAGCRHGAAHNGTTQPDRQVKLQCPSCGAIARMTGSALNRALGITCMRDGVAFAPAARRTYNRKAGA